MGVGLGGCLEDQLRRGTDVLGEANDTVRVPQAHPGKALLLGQIVVGALLAQTLQRRG